MTRISVPWLPCFALKKTLCTLTAIFACAANPECLAQSWMLISDFTFKGARGEQMRPRVLSFDPSRTELRVLSVRFESEKEEATLSELGSVLSSRAGLRDSSWAMVNGGLSSFHPAASLGLLVVNRQVYSTLSDERPRSVSPSSTDLDQWRWSGVLCQRAPDRRWIIQPAKEYIAGSCINALQSGPMLVEPGGQVGISENEPSRSRPYERSAVCLLSNGHIRLIVVPQKTHLKPFADWLAKAEEKGGLGCRVALNLSGDTSSGMVIHNRRQRGLDITGPASFPIPSALLVVGGS